jgi:hypothetical protein
MRQSFQFKLFGCKRLKHLHATIISALENGWEPERASDHLPTQNTHQIQNPVFFETESLGG